MRLLYHAILTTLTLVITLQTALGQEYHRIISLVPSVTQSIYHLRAQERLVGCTSYCTDGVEDGKPVVASVVKMNVEKVISLKPDLIIVSEMMNPKDMEALTKFGIRTVTLPSPTALEEIYNQYLLLAGYLGATDRARVEIAETRRAVQEIRGKRMIRSFRPKVFFQIGIDPIFAVMGGNFVDNYISILAADNVARDLKQGTVGREYVISKDPDYIFVGAQGAEGEAEVEAWLRHTTLRAAKTKRVYLIDPEIACQPTPATFLQTLRVMDRLMD